MNEKIEHILKKRYIIKNDLYELMRYFERNYAKAYHRNHLNKRLPKTRKYHFRDYRKILKIADKNISRCTFYDANFSKTPSFCLDTCVVHDIFKKFSHPNYHFPKEYEKLILELTLKAMNREIKLYTCPTCVSELNHLTQYSAKTMKKYFNLLNIEVIKQPDAKTDKKILNMMYNYTNKLKDTRIAEYEETFNEKVNPFFRDNGVFENNPNEKFEFINDARIMAYSAVAGLPLITQNTKDFVFYNRQKVIALKNNTKGLSMFAIPLTVKQSLEYINTASKFPMINPEFVTQQFMLRPPRRHEELEK